MRKKEKQNRSGGGPVTIEGKFSSSQNSTEHGMCQRRFLLLPGESVTEYEALKNTLASDYNIDSPAVLIFVEGLAEAEWMRRRCTAKVCRLEAQLFEAEESQPDNLELIDRLEKRLQNAYRYKTAAENSFARAFRILEKFRKARYDEDLKDGQFELAQMRIIEQCACQRYKLGLPLKLDLHDYFGDHDEPKNDEAT